MTDADVLVVGGGIAGWSAAYFAARAGRRVTLVDEGVHRASDLPIALINPLRGRTGRLVAHGIEGMHASLALIDALRSAGHAIDGARGVYRPLIGVGVEARAEAYWTDRIGKHLAFDWHDVAPPSLGLAAPVPALYLRDAAWVAPGTLLDALRAASGAAVVTDRATSITRDEAPSAVRWRVALAGGSTVVARTVLWCGGAWGAALLDRPATDASPASTSDGVYKPGSLVAVDGCITSAALSFGLYAAPWTTAIDGRRQAGTLIGPTREDAQSTFAATPLPAATLSQLGDRIGREFGTTMRPWEAWRGVRLARLSTVARHALRDVPTLTAPGSRGFLMAPLQAAAWARSL